VKWKKQMCGHSNFDQHSSKETVQIVAHGLSVVEVVVEPGKFFI
jgi:hypothetical protein